MKGENDNPTKNSALTPMINQSQIHLKPTKAIYIYIWSHTLAGKVKRSALEVLGNVEQQRSMEYHYIPHDWAMLRGKWELYSSFFQPQLTGTRV